MGAHRRFPTTVLIDDTDSPYSIDGEDGTILADATNGAITINLPAVASNTHRVITVKKTDSSSNAVTLDGNASETIDGSTTLELSSQNEFVTIQSDGSQWYVVSETGGAATPDPTDWKESVRVATTADLDATRTSNTLTANFNGDLNTGGGIDGLTDLAVNDRVLVKDEGAGEDNGIYTITDLGSASTPWTMDRTSDADTDAEVTSGLTVHITEGTENGNKNYQLTTDDPITLNTTSLTFEELTAAASDHAGSGSNSTQVGSGAIASVTSGTAVGVNALANFGAKGTAFGFDARATGDSSTSSGAGSRATGSGSTAYGEAANVTGTGSVGVGPDVIVSVTDSNAIGRDAQCQSNATQSNAFGAVVQANGAKNYLYGYNIQTTSSESNIIAVGSEINPNGSFQILLGSDITVSGTTPANVIAIGDSANPGHANVIVFGRSAASTDTNQCVFGSSDSNINDYYFGQGVTVASVTDVTLNATGGSGTDIAGASIDLNGGPGTGAGTGGGVRLRCAPAGTTGSTPNTLQTGVEVIDSSGELGIGLYGVTPTTQAAHIEDPSGGATVDSEARTAINSILVALENIGITASV